MAATDAQRAAVAGRPCIVCGAEHRVDAAHVVPRALGCGDALDVVPLCRACHRAYDAGELDLLPYLSRRRPGAVAHAVGHVGLIGVLRSGGSGVRTRGCRPPTRSAPSGRASRA